MVIGPFGLILKFFSREISLVKSNNDFVSILGVVNRKKHLWLQDSHVNLGALLG